MISKGTSEVARPTRSAPPAAAPNVLLHGISWELYESLLESVENQNVRMTYDRGELEFMSPLPVHEKFKALMKMMIEIAAAELGLDVAPFGSMTCRRSDLSRGLEPDECFFFKNAQMMWEKAEFDFKKDSPPELAIEIDNMSSSINRVAVYEALKVPELWRYNGKTCRIYHLVKGKYTSRKHSRIFPMLTLTEIAKWMRAGERLLPKAFSDEFRNWFRMQMK